LSKWLLPPVRPSPGKKAQRKYLIVQRIFLLFILIHLGAAAAE